MILFANKKMLCFLKFPRIVHSSIFYIGNYGLSRGLFLLLSISKELPLYMEGRWREIERFAKYPTVSV